MAKKTKQVVTEDLVPRSPWDYDIEQFANFFLVVFWNVTTNEWRHFIIYADTRDEKLNINHTEALINFIEREVLTLIGYNNHDYDDLMLKHILLNKEMFLKGTKISEIVTSMKRLNDRIINQQKIQKITGKKDNYLINLKRTKRFSSLDLLALFNTVDKVSLKQIAINLKWPNIIDLPFDPDHIVVADEIPTIIHYCKNDVQITRKLRIYKEPDIKFRKELGALYKINVLNSNNTNITKKIIQKFYCEETKIDFDDIRNKKTFYQAIDLRTCVSPRIRFSTQKYQLLLNTIRNKRVSPYKSEAEDKKKKQFEYLLQSKYVMHTIGLGGIHSNNLSEEFREDATHEYIDIDVDSFYPWIIVNEGLFPKHLGPVFVRVYKEKILEVRMKAKKLAKQGIEVDENTIINEALKNTLNSTFGLTKSIFSWLYDPHVATYICITGQLFLLMLMERIEELTDSIVVYSNTDGLTAKVPRATKDDFLRVCKQWEQATGFSLEYTNYRRMILQNVNNYLMITSDKGKEYKEKGLFVTKKKITQGYRYPIVAKALYEYYINDIPVDRTIKSSNDVFDFMAAERTSLTKYVIYMWPRGEEDSQPVKLQKSNRWIVTKGNKHEGRIIKYSKTRKKKGTNQPAQINMQKGRFLTLVNNVEGFEDVTKNSIDYEFYMLEAIKVIKSIRTYKTVAHNRLIQASLY